MGGKLPHLFFLFKLVRMVPVVLSRCWVTVFFYFFIFLTTAAGKERGPLLAEDGFAYWRLEGGAPLFGPAQAPPTTQRSRPRPRPCLGPLPESSALTRISASMVVTLGSVCGLLLLIIVRASRSAGEVTWLCGTLPFQILCRILALLPSQGLVWVRIGLFLPRPGVKVKVLLGGQLPLFPTHPRSFT